jgi:hypothetical protein
VTAFSRYKKPDKKGFLKLSITVFIVTAFSESQIRHKWTQMGTNGRIGFAALSTLQFV